MSSNQWWTGITFFDTTGVYTMRILPFWIQEGYGYLRIFLFLISFVSIYYQKTLLPR